MCAGGPPSLSGKHMAVRRFGSVCAYQCFEAWSSSLVYSSRCCPRLVSKPVDDRSSRPSVQTSASGKHWQSLPRTEQPDFPQGCNQGHYDGMNIFVYQVSQPSDSPCCTRRSVHRGTVTEILLYIRIRQLTSFDMGYQFVPR